MTLAEFPDFGSLIISPKTEGTICHDTPNLSLSHPQGCFSPPSESPCHNRSISSCVSHPAFSCPHLLSPIELRAEPVEAGLPQAAVLSHPFVQLAEWLGAQRIKALLPLCPHTHEPRRMQDAEVPRDARLVNVHGFHERVYGALPGPERLHDPAARRIGEDLENDRFHGGDIHACVYTLFCISR